MLGQWIIKELEMPECKHIKRHILDIKEHNYRQSLSFSSFFHGLKERNRTETRLFIATHITDHEITEAVWQKTRKRLKLGPEPELEEIHHATIWDFYKYIGYDYKTKKWTQNECQHSSSKTSGPAADTDGN